MNMWCVDTLDANIELEVMMVGGTTTASACPVDADTIGLFALTGYDHLRSAHSPTLVPGFLPGLALQFA